MRDFVKLPNFNAVAAGQTATVNLPATNNWTYHRLMLTYTESGTLVTQANMQAAITGIRVLIDGKVQRTMSAAELIMMNAFYGDAYAAGYLTIYFSEPWRRTPQAEDTLAWPMGDVSTFTLEVDIAAGRTAPALSVKGLIERDAVDSEGKPRVRLGAIKKIKRHTVPITLIGVNNYSTLPKGDAYSALHCVSPNVLNMVVTADGRERFNANSADITELFGQEGLQRQTGVFSVVFDATKRLGDVLPTNNLSDLRLEFDMSAATSFVMLSEAIGYRD
jgi:hypothetical protein